MDFSFTEEQDLLRDSVRKLVDKDYSFSARGALLKSDLGFSRSLWKHYSELGWTALPFSEADGGLGGKAVDTMIVLEELGRGLVLEPYTTSIIFAGALLKQASDALRGRYLPALIEGDLIAAVAYTEPESRFDLAQVLTSAKRDGDGYVLNGQKIAVLGGSAANLFIVSARTSGKPGDRDGITLFAVDGNSAGLSKLDYPTVDGLRASNLTFSNLKVGSDQIIGSADKGYALLERASDETIIALGAEAVGVFSVLFKSTVAYTKERKQFGVPIAAFQVLQHRMVDMYTEYELSKSMLYMATMTLDAGKPIARAASALKVQLGKSGRFIGQAAIQNHGGMGMTDELAVSHYFKRATILELTLGNTEHHLERYRTLGG
jgi:alkylation response protein AidB-like acyl-CoA dehydrogenase